MTDPSRSGLSEQIADLTEQFDIVLRELRTARQEIEEHSTYCTDNGLPVDEAVVGWLAADAEHAGQRIIQQRQQLAHSTSDAAELLTASELVLRFGLATLAYVRGALEWVAQSYSQSKAVQFFNVRAQNSPNLNYQRNEHPAVSRVERQLHDVLGLSDRFGLSVTSSGMAAFTVIESFLIRHRLRPGDTILLSPYIYFEAFENLDHLPFVTVQRAAGYGVDDIISGVIKYRPRCIFVDQVANTEEQRLIDLPELFRRLREVVTERTTVVVDGTVIAAALPADLLISDDKVEILYYESCTKYLQLGMDASLAGLVVYPKEIFEPIDMARRNSGTILYRHNSELFPRYNREFLRRRMRRICGNAERLATLLNTDPRVLAEGRVCHPVLPNHPDVAIARTLPYASGFVTFSYHEADRNDRDGLNVVVDDILANAREDGVLLTKGVSFGYSVPRVWAADIYTEGVPPFLRFYVGDRGTQLELLAETIVRSLPSRMTRRLVA